MALKICQLGRELKDSAGFARLKEFISQAIYKIPPSLACTEFSKFHLAKALAQLGLREIFQNFILQDLMAMWFSQILSSFASKF